jgi:hypothetical protein
MRSICSRCMIDINVKFGGINKDLEIDESLVAKVKYHVGKGLGIF